MSVILSWSGAQGFKCGELAEEVFNLGLRRLSPCVCVRARSVIAENGGRHELRLEQVLNQHSAKT